MAVNLKGRDLISVHDLSVEEVEQIFDTAAFLKMQNKMGTQHKPLQGRTLGMIFSKSSTRTRVSFEVGIYQLGGYALYLSQNDLQLNRGETIADTARVISRYLDGIMIRTFKHQDVVDLAKYADIPVINGLTDDEHPCQALADLFTVREKFGKDLRGRKMVFVGDGNNVAISVAHACAKVGMDFVLGAPAGYEINERYWKEIQDDMRITGATASVVHDPYEAVKGADVIYSDVFVSMGQEADKERKLRELMPFQVNSKLMQAAKPETLFMHCLPAHRGEEVTDEVADSPNSVIFDEAENRLHVQKAIMALLMR
ncbi:MAG: ornithine carbamoyltransferase [Chloroflexota bacterium]